MSILSDIANLVKKAGDGATKFNQEVEAYAEEYRNESDEFLKRKIKNGYTAQRYAAGKVLKERGYGSN